MQGNINYIMYSLYSIDYTVESIICLRLYKDWKSIVYIPVQTQYNQ